jgi:PhoH-like ATPase
MRRKTFVLDTNVLLDNPKSIKEFGNNKVVIPIYVVEEIDKFKNEPNELGRNARHVARSLDELRKKGSLTNGVSIGESLLQVKVPIAFSGNELTFADNKVDSKILSLALGLENSRVILVTKDINLRIRASALGLETEDYLSEDRDVSELYTGIHNIQVDGETIDLLFNEKEASIPNTSEKILENSFGVLSDGRQKSALVRFYPSKGIMKSIRGQNAWGVHARNKEQLFALELLMDNSIKLVTLVGHGGTGKTLLALCAGLQKVTEDKTYNKLSAARPIFPLGRDIGYTPGSIQEKVRPWMQGIYDNLEFLMGLSTEDKKKGRCAEEFIDMGLVNIEPLTYIRGRSMPNQFILIDECQNTSKHEIKTIITRCGEGTKIVLVGDIDQIDNPHLDSIDNGLSYTVDRFKGQKVAGHVTLRKGERSSLAELAAQLL